MGNLRSSRTVKETAWNLIVGLLLVGLIGGCKFVEVYVNVDSCPAGQKMTIPGGGGGCYQGSQINPPVAATGAYIQGTSPAVYADSTYQCTSGTYCGSIPGTCQFKKCIWVFTPDSPGSKTGSCSCGCPPM